MAVCETFLKPGTSFSIPQYTIHRLDRSTGPKGGLMIIIKNNIQFKILSTFKLKTIEAIGIEIMVRHNPVSIIDAYHPGSNANVRNFISDVRSLTKLPPTKLANPSLKKRKKDNFPFIFRIPLHTSL